MLFVFRTYAPSNHAGRLGAFLFPSHYMRCIGWRLGVQNLSGNGVKDGHRCIATTLRMKRPDYGIVNRNREMNQKIRKHLVCLRDL
jgi:hypothetical protein